MKFALVFVVAISGTVALAKDEIQLCEPWRAEYAEEDATGGHVIGLWQFNSGGETTDASGNGRELTVRGVEIASDGLFGACLESFPGWPVEDQRHQATAKSEPELSPKGPFSIELWIKPKAEMEGYPDAFLIDKKYVAHDDYQLVLGAADRNGSRLLRACLGFGIDSSTWYSKPAKFEPGSWYHVAFTYDAAGTGSFYLNGLPWGSTRIDGRKAISPGQHFLSIGDRIGSYYHGFPGFIDQVRLSNKVLEFSPARFQPVSTRSCFVRMEAKASQRFTLTNLQRTPLAAATVTMKCDFMREMEMQVADLSPGASVAVDYSLDTSLRPDSYRLTAGFNVPGQEGFETEETFQVTIVPRHPPNRFPVVMWGVYGGISDEIDRLKKIGFTHALGLGADFGRIWEAGKPIEAHDSDKLEETRRALDDALANGLTLAAGLSPGSYLRSNQKFHRVDPEGKPFTDREDVCGLFPELREFCYNVGASVAQTYGDHPALGAAMIHTEVRGHARPCFHPHDVEAFRQQSGMGIPKEAVTQRGVDYTKLADFPESRVIPDDHPIYKYYRWFWKQGDGWNELNTAVHRGLKSTGRQDLWTWHDPAVRVAGVYGSGGEVDFLSQWTYSYPDPIRIGLSTDELLAMSAGGPSGQQVMKMTQIIWYRSQTAPEPAGDSQQLPYRARWEREQPGAAFITIAPMHLREAFWAKIARPIKGIMYHGWQSLVPCQPPGGYRFTHPQAQHELARLIRQVVRPLGPTLLAVPGVKSDVAFLESFASEMFARRGTYGWNHTWTGDAYHVMLYAHLQPEIVFDETVIERGLDGYRLLVMTDCDVITESMQERIKAFQASGGLIVADERLAPAIKPDIVLPVYQRTGRADQDKAALQSLAAEFRENLDARYRRYLDSSNPDVIPYLRRYKGTDYVFLVNDNREYGQYVGQHGKLMENGLPSEARVSVARPSGFVYDLVAGREVAASSADGKLSIDAHLGPCDGRMLMITSRPIGSVKILAPQTVTRGDRVSLVVEVVDADGDALDAIVPLEVNVRDAEGRLAEFSGYYQAADGAVTINLDVAPNDPFGIWQIEARELGSGRVSVHYVRVAAPSEWPPSVDPSYEG